MKNKEFGSDFHYFYDENSVLNLGSLFQDQNLEYFFSGRVALYNLLQFGQKKYKWHKVGFPSYYCHEVVDFCKNLPLEVEYYNYNPFDEDEEVEWEDESGSVFINVDFFGIKKLDCSFLRKTEVIEDLTHNLESLSRSSANYCFGSLRKQLPLAVGGVIWSRHGDFAVNLEDNRFSNQIALKKLTAMYLKSEYLEGRFSHKDSFRTLYLEAEELFGDLQTNTALPKIVQAQLKGLVPRKLIEKTRLNINYGRKLLELSKNIVCLSAENGTEMGFAFLCGDYTIREKFRTYLISHNIFPAVLWPNQISERDIEIQHRVLFVHVDFRYNQKDIYFIVDVINKFIKHV
ncbi:hypothetical protein [Sphingobacterium sp. SGR-19]|uniref:hypothetical protein n=1 Tax=Sphingobacterium sp. SGR-19 TaxID=2710886 RepID=UPI0013EAC91B|nr:hypothetical protein [Sphingobacterium sp. SGR-19]NGM67213.1 hypothetical protein [Sphingobacterium sp. SGR-19]